MAPPVLDLFLELVAIRSPSGDERAAADRVGVYLTELGLEWDEDASGPKVGSNAGNIYCRLPGADAAGAGGAPIFLCAHLDTVPPTTAIEPVVEDGVVRNASDTILGADNKAAVAAMLEAARRIVGEQRPHAGVELVFTTKEEVGLVGAGAFDTSRLEARLGFVYDHAAPIGEIVAGAPFGRSLEIRFHGRAAHAGIAPEEGRSAIAAAARAIADLRLGRLDPETTANVGVISGGSARNVVPEWCVVTAEARSHDEATIGALVQEMLDACAFAASISDCTMEAEVREQYRGYRFLPDDPVLRLAETALRAVGATPTTALCGGGADANVFNAAGIPCVVLANGMAAIHSPDEHIAVADIETMVDVTLELVEAARRAA
ncbi:MAG TPA: M20/M25/M40 family metallo-hydrolase [Gaiellaceae bacterium]|nr:M20/M25/M40 family metallo-hydrolase [Gaiellaceae bacterium]